MQTFRQCSDTSAIVTALPDFVLGAYLRQIDNDPRQQRFTGLLIFDLLVINGLSTNRFISAQFVDGVVDDQSIDVCNPEPELLSIQNEYFVNHPELIRDSVLSQAEQTNFLNQQQA